MINKRKKFSGGGAKWNGNEWYSDPKQKDPICFQYTQLEANVLNILHIEFENRETGFIGELKYLLEDIEYKGNFNMSIKNSMKLVNSEILIQLSQIITQAGELRLLSQRNIIDEHKKKNKRENKVNFVMKDVFHI